MLPARDFNEFSGSVGLLFRPAAANDKFVIAVEPGARGAQPGARRAVFLRAPPRQLRLRDRQPDRWRPSGRSASTCRCGRGSRRVRGEVTFFRNGIDDFIFRNPLSEEEFEAREEEFDERFGVVDEPGGGHEHDDEFPFVEFVGADSTLYGIEAHADVKLTDSLVAEITYDWVRGELTDSNQPLPRIPPFRVIPGPALPEERAADGRRHHGHWRSGPSVWRGNANARGGVLKLFGSYSFVAGGVTNTITARLDNATNRLYRNHLNYLKDVLPEIGRNFKLVYSVSF